MKWEEICQYTSMAIGGAKWGVSSMRFMTLISKLMLEMKFLAFENLENLACQKFSYWIVYDVSCWIIGGLYGGFHGHYYEIDGLMQNLNEDLNGG